MTLPVAKRLWSRAKISIFMCQNVKILEKIARYARHGQMTT